MSNSSNARLAKNTIILYGRTIIVMLVTLYVSRLILNILGVSDYGVYNAVGGMVGMFSLISSSLVAATQRYISFELGKRNGHPNYVFSLAMGLHLAIGLVVFVVAETLGVWFLNAYMNFPDSRMVAANWVFQFSILAFVLQILSIPYNAIIVAQERMGFFALIGIMEVLLKLFFALLLLVVFSDKLVYYAISMSIVAFTTFFMNVIYCRKKFIECCKYQLIFNRSAYNKMGGFIGWNFLGSSATVLSKQGTNVLLNIFCGIIVNAGRGVATQVDNAVSQFVNSFSTALRPQITKTYAAHEYPECFRLVNQGTKMIMFLILLFVVPLTLRTDYVLTLWLKLVPDYAILFTRLSFLIVFLDSLSTPLYFLMLATGHIKNYQIVAGTLGLLTFPLTWIALMYGMAPEVAYYVLFVIDVFRWIIQLVFLKELARFDVRSYMSKAITPVLFVSVSAIIPCVIIDRVLPNNLLGFVCFCISSIVILAASILLFGLTRNERETTVNMVRQYVKNKFA